MQETANKQKRITLKTLHEMLDGMSVELAEKVHLLFMANYIDYSDYDFRDVDETGHFPNKHTRLNNWCRYQRKRIKAGVMPEEQRVLFEALAKSRSDEHTGGRRKKNVPE